MEVKKAFTLAEVLITMTIIGVIAALTIPTLIKKYDEAATVSKVKKMYTTIANAVRVWQVENGCDTDVGDCLKQYERYDCKNAFGGIEKKLGIVAHRYQNESVNNIEWLPETNYGLNGTESTYSWQGVNTLSPAYGVCQYLFKDGTTMMVSLDDNKNNFFVFIDTNGKKKPNRVGIDVFPIGIGSHNNKIKTVNPYYVEDNTTIGQGLCYYRNNSVCNPDACTKTSCSPTAYVLKNGKLPPITW